MNELLCAQAEELFSDHYDGTLAEPARRDLEAHLSSCPTCRALREVFGEVVDVLHRVRDHPFAAPPGLAARAAAAALAAPTAGVWPRGARPRVQQLPLGLQLVAAVLAIALTLGLLGASGALGTEGRLSRLRARTVSTAVHLAERKDRLVEDLRLLKIVVGTALEGRLDRVQERVEDYRRLLEKRRTQPSPEPAKSSDSETISNSDQTLIVQPYERQERRSREPAEQGARS